MKEGFYHQVQNTFNSEFSTSVYEGDGGLVSPNHFHKNFEILITIKGFCDCSVNGQKYHLTEGEAIFICPFQMHWFSVGESSSVRRVNFHEHLILTIAQSIDGRIPKNPVFCATEDIMSFFLECMEYSFGKDGGPFTRIAPYHKRMRIKGLLYLIGGEFLSSAEFAPITKSDEVTMDIALYVSENFKKNITLQDVAREKGYNSQYISRIFNRVMGMNFKKMLNQFRLEYAYAMLQDTDLPISRICFESGFQSIRSFNQSCRDTFGKAPKEIRKDRTSTI